MKETDEDDKTTIKSHMRKTPSEQFSRGRRRCQLTVGVNERLASLRLREIKWMEKETCGNSCSTRSLVSSMLRGGEEEF